MRHWSQLGIRNWRVKPGRTACALSAIALGVGVVVWVTCAYESVRLSLEDQVWFWIGRSHLSVESFYGLYSVIPEKITEDVLKDPNVSAATPRLKHGMLALPISSAGQPSPAATQPTATPGPVDLRAAILTPPSPTADDTSAGVHVVAVGIVPASEDVFRAFNQRDIVGRMLRPSDTDSAVVDRGVAAALNLKLGDQFILRNETTGTAAPAHETEGALTVVGLIDLHRVAKRQKPLIIAPLRRVQALTGKLAPPGPSVTRVDILLKDASPAQMRQTQARIQRLLRSDYPNDATTLASAEGKLRQVKAAERQTEFLLTLISTVALFTAFFVILSTLSMGMVERIGQLGMLRCLGMTRVQIALLVLAEAVPLGLVGIALGVPVGLAFAQLSVWLAPEYIGKFEISRTGLVMALVGGAVTTLLGALVPMLQALLVSPLSASRPQARKPSIIPAVAAAMLGAALIGYHQHMLASTPINQWFLRPALPPTAAALLYIGYALLAPILVLTVGNLAVRAAAFVLRIRYRLLADQVGRAAWRSAAICCGLMVGLSLVVSVVVYSASLAAGWNFPKDFCEGLIYMAEPVPYAKADAARHIPGVAESALINTQLRCKVTWRPIFDFGLTQTCFVAGVPDEFYQMAKLQFVDGDPEQAREALKKGGAILVTPEFVRAQNAKVGDGVTLSTSGRSARMKVVGVVTSPALNIAADYFSVGDYVNSASAFLVLGTMSDLERLFKAPPETNIILLNFDLKAPPEAAPAPPEFAADDPPTLTDSEAAARLFLSWRTAMPERAEELDTIQAQLAEAQAEGTRLTWTSSPLLRAFRDALNSSVTTDWQRLGDADRRWQTYREGVIMQLITLHAGKPADFTGSTTALKARIDHDLRRATILFTSVPLVALIVAALGVGNLMMANVASRTRQLAMLRAVGTTRGQILRLVLGEALVLGVMGCVLGLTLGLHMADTLTRMTTAIWGFAPQRSLPPDLLGAAIGFTLLVCLIAGLIPAWRASRSNVINAMQAT